MVDIYLAEVLAGERQHELERALIWRAQVQEALVGGHHRVRRSTLPSRALIALGTRLVAWGDRLQAAHPPVVKY